MLQEKENAVLIGTAVEELIRHHPSLKNTVYDAVKSTIISIEELGKAFVVPEDLKSWYTIQPVSAPAAAAVASSDGDIAMEAVEPEAVTQAAPTPAPAVRDPHDAEDDEAKPHGNLVTSYIDVFCKVRQSSTSRFIQ